MFSMKMDLLLCSRHFEGSLPDRSDCTGSARSTVRYRPAKGQACSPLHLKRATSGTMTGDAQPRRASWWAQVERLDGDDDEVDDDDDGDE